MISPSHLYTAEQLASLPDDECRYELVRGELRMMSPAGGLHGRIASQLLVRIGSHVEREKLGQTYAAETGFMIERNPDTVRAPDVAYVSNARLGELVDHAGYLPLAPDLVAEVMSPGDSASELEAKAHAWLRAGVIVVLVVDPHTETIREYRSTDSVDIYRNGQVDLTDVLPGFALDVVELFGRN